MKDYELEKSKKGQFILNYQIKGDKIVVYYANDDVVTISNTERNIEILDSFMRNQVENTNAFCKNCKGNILLSSFLIFIGISLMINFGFVMHFNFLGVNVLLPLMFGAAVGIVSLNTIKVISYVNALRDVKKNKRFLEVEPTLNEKIKENENMLYNTHKVTKNIVNKNKDNEIVFTINNIDKVPFSDLEQIMNNIAREDKFNFEYLEMIEQKKTKKKTK